MDLSVCIVTYNEEANIGRTLASVKGLADEIIVVDSHSTDRTVEIAQSYGAKVFVEDWKGFALQKNSANAKAGGAWILSLDADEEVSPELAASIRELLKPGAPAPQFNGYFMPRRNIYWGRWIKRGGYYPDPKLRLVKKELANFEVRLVHEDIKLPGKMGRLKGDLLHHAYVDIAGFIEHQNRYSTLSAEMVVAKKRVGFSVGNIMLRPMVRFFYNYIVRRGFLDGPEGLLVHLYHGFYVSLKYSKAWELSRKERAR